MNARALQSKDTAEERVLYMAMDLSKKRWKLVFGDGRRRRLTSVEGRNLVELSEAMDRARERFELPADVRVVSCYEAGRDGFWLHRHLTGIGVENRVVDSSSIEVIRRKRQAKTDRLDGGFVTLTGAVRSYPASNTRPCPHQAHVTSCHVPNARVRRTR